MRTVKNITKGNLYKNYLIYFLPLLASSLLSSLYSTIDAVIAGKCIGENALGAVSATGSVDVLLFAFFNGFSSGFAVYVAQLFGKGDFAAVKRNVVNMAVFITGIAFLFSLFAILFRGPILDYLNIDPVLRRDAELYFVIYTASYLFQYLNMVLMHALFALGVTSFSFYITLTSAVINIGGNLLTVLVFGWGVAGLAISTVVSVLAVSCIYFAVMRRAFSDLKSEKVSYRFSLRCVRESISYTIPTALQKIAFHITGIFIAPALNGLGAEATTGYSVLSRMYNLCGSSFWNMCSAVDCHTAQAVGEGSVSKVRKGIKVGFWMNLAALTPFVVVFAFFAEPIASIKRKCALCALHS